MKKIILTTLMFLSSPAFSATGVPIFDNLGSLIKGDVKTLSQNTGLTKGERQQGWFSPPPVIKNFSNENEKQTSDTILTQPSVNYTSHVDIGSYSGDNLDGNNLFDFKAPAVKLENSFFTEQNGVTEYLTINIKPIQLDEMKLDQLDINITRAHDNGPQALGEMQISLTTTDKFGKELQPRAIFKVKKGVENPGYYYKINEDNIVDKQKGYAYLKVIYKYPYLEKEFYQTFLIDTLLIDKSDKKDIMVERISLIHENLRKPIPEDSIKKIKVYIDELSHMSPFYNDMISSNDDVVIDDLSFPGKLVPINMTEKTNIRNFLTYYSHTTLYKDNILENFHELDYAPYRGYWIRKSGLAEKLTNNSLYQKNEGYVSTKTKTLTTYTFGGKNPGVNKEILEQETKDNSMITFIDNILEIPNYPQSMFINQWNQMISSIGLKFGGIILFDKEQKITPLDLYQLYYKVQDKDVKNFKNVQYSENASFSSYKKYFETLQNIDKSEISPKKDLNFNEKFSKFTEDVIGEDKIIKKSLYMLMSFEEYAATWGLTAAEAHKLFYFDNFGRMIWKYEGLKDYFSKKTLFDLNFIDFNNKKSFSVGQIKSSLKISNPNKKEITDFIFKNLDTLNKFFNKQLNDTELTELYNNKDNIFLAKKLQKLSEKQEDNGKIIKPFNSFYELFVFENCYQNTVGYPQGVCADTSWNEGRIPTPAIGIPENQPKKYIKANKNSDLIKDLYSGNFEKVANAIKNGANVNAKNNLGFRPIEIYLSNGVTENNGLIIEPALFYYLVKKGSQFDQSYLDEFKNHIQTIKTAEGGRSLFDFASGTDTPAVAQVKEIVKNLQDIKDGNKTIEQIIEEDIDNTLLNQNLNLIQIGIKIGHYFAYGMTKRDINSLLEPMKCTILQLVSLSDAPTLVQALINAGADINIASPGNNDWEAIHFAGGYSSKEVIKTLLDNGADINKRVIGNEKGNPDALNIAVSNNQFPQVKYLIELGASLDKKYFENDNSILSFAVETKNIEMVQYLISKGADINYVNPKGHRIIDFAKGYEMKKYLKSIMQ